MDAIVLGGSRGIGAAIASALSESGYQVLAASSSDVNTSDMESIPALLGTAKSP